MKTLFAAADAQQHSAFKDVPRADSLQVFNNDPVDMCTELVMDGADANCCVHYSIQVTPRTTSPQHLLLCPASVILPCCPLPYIISYP